MAEKACSFSEAMALLKGSLAGLGLESTGIALACCGGSREKSSLIAQKLVDGGFGRAVKPAGRPVRYETRDGWFSWDTVAEGDDMINLFYSLEADDRPVDYLVGEAGGGPGQSPDYPGEGRRETGPGANPEDFQKKAVPGDSAGGELWQAGSAGGRLYSRAQKAGPDYRGDSSESNPGQNSQIKVRRRLF